MVQKKSQETFLISVQKYVNIVVYRAGPLHLFASKKILYIAIIMLIIICPYHCWPIMLLQVHLLVHNYVFGMPSYLYG